MGTVNFPVYLHVFGLRLHPHPVMEAIGYFVGFQLYLLIRRRTRGAIPFEQNVWILVGAVFGALVGSKLLAWVESWPDYWRLWHAGDFRALLEVGKTIVGGLLGGWAGVEIAKKMLQVRTSTGDVCVFPLIVGMSIGRVGCFLTGLADHTHGNHTALPWAVDFGDGPRHPTQLYDIVFLLLLGAALLWRWRRPHRQGEIFRLFILFYCAYRFVVEFIKPTYRPYLGLSAIQLACAGAVGLCAWLLIQQATPAIAQLLPGTAR